MQLALITYFRSCFSHTHRPFSVREFLFLGSYMLASIPGRSQFFSRGAGIEATYIHLPGRMETHLSFSAQSAERKKRGQLATPLDGFIIEGTAASIFGGTTSLLW